MTPPPCVDQQYRDFTTLKMHITILVPEQTRPSTRPKILRTFP